MLRSFCRRAAVSRVPLDPCRRSFTATLSSRFSSTPFAAMASTGAALPRLPIFERINGHDPRSVAVVHSESGDTYTYGQLLRDVAAQARHITSAANGKSLQGERIAFLIENGYDYVVTFLAVRAVQAIALPMSGGFPAHELSYLMNQSQAAMLLNSKAMQDKADQLMKEDDIEHSPIRAAVQQFAVDDAKADQQLELSDFQGGDKSGLMLYTSGTTSKPKGVLLPGPVLTAQEKSLYEAWQYQTSDRLLHVLPLHHIHGVMNALYTPLYAGSSIEFMFPFKAETAWRRFAAPFLDSARANPAQKKPVSFFTVVPTIYSRLMESFPNLPADVQTAAKQGISPAHLRLNFSGSAALPTPTKAAWTELSSGNVLLERYGMTEVGMALSCGLARADRVDGAVGWPLPSVQARLVDTDSGAVIAPGEEQDSNGRERQGEIQLRGPTIFAGYFRNDKATADEFVAAATDDPDQSRWFKTGDVATRRAVPGAGESKESPWARGPLYFIAGRKSADIIKTGGEKVSALEVEREMLALPQVREVAVVGVPSAKWGQKVAAVVVLSDEGRTAGKDGGPWSALDARRAMKERVAAYKCPMEMKTVDELPRNAMGKINKKTLVNDVFADKISPPPTDRK